MGHLLSAEGRSITNFQDTARFAKMLRYSPREDGSACQQRNLAAHSSA
jgi:hypothetical protein